MHKCDKFVERRLGVFCCGHVFRRERSVMLVGHQEGDWQFLCGKADHVDPKEPYHVSVGILLDVDSSLNDVADLPIDFEAERSQVGSAWIRTRCGANEA
jgi:hypothetical protein